MFKLRAELCPTADAYYYRAVAYCKEFCPNGQLQGRWDDLAACIDWPLGDGYGVERLRELFRTCGLAVGPLDELWNWDDTNGWIIRQFETNRIRKEEKRKAGKASGKARRKAKQLRLALEGKKRRQQKSLPFPRAKPRTKKDSKRLVGRWVSPTVHGQSTDSPRTENPSLKGIDKDHEHAATNAEPAPSPGRAARRDGRRPRPEADSDTVSGLQGDRSP
jgi:hypothetical protein